MPEKRLKKVSISFPFLLDMLTEGFVMNGKIVIDGGLPKDALFVSSHFDENRMEAYLVFSHPSFSLLVEGAEIPILPIGYRKANEEAHA